MASFRDLLRDTKSRIREVDTATAADDLDQPGTVVLDVREPDEYEQGALPGAIHIPRGHLESQVEGRITDHDAHVVVYCAGGTRSAFAADTLGQLGYTRRGVGGRRLQQVEGRGPPVEHPGQPDAPSSATATSATSSSRRWTSPASRSCCESKVLLARRRRARLARRLVSGRGRRRHARHHRHGRRRRVQPAAPDPAQPGADRRAQGRFGQEDPDRAEPRRQRGHLRRPPRRRQRPRHLRRLRRDRRRDRQLPDPLPRQRRLPQAGHPGRARVDLPFRGPGQRVPAPPGTVLPLPGPRAAAAGAGSVLCRGRRARRAAAGSSAASRPWRPSSSCSGIGDPLVGRLLAYDALEESFRTFKVNRDPECAACSIPKEQLVIAEYDELCMPHPIAPPS